MTSPPQCGVSLIQQFEGCKLEAYLDQRGIPTIGYGHIKDVSMGDTCTQEQADAWLVEDCSWAWAAVCNDVKVPLNENQSGALLSFVYSLGEPQFLKSTLLRFLNMNNYSVVPVEIAKWVWCNMPDGSRQVSKGLQNRRMAELTLWLKPVTL
jgi:lysozyme